MLPLLLLGSLGLAGPAVPGNETPYERVLAKALAQAETDLVEDIDLWVDHSSWENAWEVSSEHYTVRTTESRFAGLSAARDLDTMLGHFQRVLGTDFVPDEPFLVLIFPTMSEYNTFGDSVGAEHSSAFGSFYADQDPRLPVATYHVQNYWRLGMWMTHSAFHQYVARAFRASLPTTVSEGLACYFELYWTNQYAIHNELKDSPAYTPMGSLLQASFQSLMSDPDRRLVQLGLFFAYLLEHREDTRLTAPGEQEPENSFAEYLRRTVRGQDANSTGFARLVSEDLEALEEDFRAFTFPGR